MFNQQRPDFSFAFSFNVLRARIGVRGVVFPLDDRINYFFLAEFGNNGLTQPTGHAAQLSDASITLNYIPHARIRVGEFKYPGSEEGMMGIPAFNFVNFSQVTNQMMLERQFAVHYRFADPKAPGGTAGRTRRKLAGRSDRCVPGHGHTGLRLVRRGHWELAYAAMLGPATELNVTDNNRPKTVICIGLLPGFSAVKARRRQSWKTYVWYQDGKRTLACMGITCYGVDRSAGAFRPQTFDRKRYGIGTTFRRGKIRADAEYMRGEGMIFNSTTGGAAPGQSGSVRWPEANATSRSDFNILPNQKSNGWYIDGGYEVMPKLWLEARYDRYNRAHRSGERRTGISRPPPSVWSTSSPRRRGSS